MKSKAIIWRLALEIVVLLMAFNAVNMRTAPSDTTAAAVLEAVNRKQLEPICMVEVNSAIRSAALSVTAIAALLLLCSDAWALWQSRRKV